ncbi:MAG: MFS transporter [Frankia sp.]
MPTADTRQNRQITFVVLVVAVAAFSLLQSLVSPVLPLLQHDLHTSQNTVTWVMTAYLLSASVFTPILGRVGDMVGKERVLVATLVALTIGSLVAALAPNILVMIVARVIQGVGGAVLPLSFGIVRDEFPRDKVAGAVGTLAALLAVGAGLGLVLAGPIVELLNPHWLFWIPMIICIGAAIAAHFFVPESPVRNPGTIAWRPAILLSSWLVALLVGVSEGSLWGWTSGRILGLFALALGLAAAWIWSELRASEPLIDMRMMRAPAVWTTNLVALLFGASIYATMAFMPQFVQTPKSAGYGFGASITESGIFMLPLTIGMFVSGIYAGKLANIIGSKAILIIGSLISVPTYGLMAFAHGQRWEIYLASLLLGAGVGAAFAAMANLIVEAVPPAQTGVASGMNANIRTIGGSIGSAVVGGIVTSQLASNGLPKESGYAAGFAVLGIVTVLATLAGFLIPTRRAAAATTEWSERPEVVENGELALIPGGTLVEEIDSGPTR